MLNRALRLLEADIMVNMGFFIYDLHRQIQQMHAEQVSRYEGKSFVVYRGQGLSTTDFAKLKRTQGGLISFNCFLSTSQDKNESLKYAQCALSKNDMAGVLFTLTIDPRATLTSFAQIKEQSAVQAEMEILFTMHTVFRIGSIAEIDESGRLFEVQLVLTADDDKQLSTLAQHFDEQIQGYNGWARIGALLIQVGSLEKTEELYTSLTSQSSNPIDRALYNNCLGSIKSDKGEYEEALIFYGKALDINKKTLPAAHPSLAVTYNNIGSVHDNMGDYSRALEFYRQSLDIYLKSLPPNHPDLATTYNNIGSVHDNMGD